MVHPLAVLSSDPWRALSQLVDGPLHPGGVDATETLLSRAGVDDGTRLLDIGCGAGDAMALARDRGARAIGLDRDPRGSAVVRADLAAFPFEERCFDVVLGECVLCLSPDLEETLRESARVLEPGGRLALSDVTVSGQLPEMPPPIDDLLCLDGPREQTDICRHIEHVGFEIDDVRTHPEALLAMRDRLLEPLDTERLIAALGDRGTQLRDGANDLEAAIETGQIGYVSIVATHRP